MNIKYCIVMISLFLMNTLIGWFNIDKIIKIELETMENVRLFLLNFLI